MELWTLVFILILLLTYCMVLKNSVASGENIKDVQKLFDDMFDEKVYNKQFRGQLDLTDVATVDVWFHVKHIRKINEVEETIEIIGVVFLSWSDQRLIWNPADYNGTTTVFREMEDVWTPEIILENSAESTNFLGDSSRMVIKYTNDGTASMEINGLFVPVCSLNMTSYPWDKQSCPLNFAVWGYTNEQVQLQAYGHCQDETGYQNSFVENSLWEILDVQNYVQLERKRSVVTFEIVLQRRPTFFILSVLLPIISICVLNIFVFLIPVESGERTSFTLTVLLSIALFQTMIASSLPADSEKIPHICNYLFFTLLTSIVICLLNILVLRIYYNHQQHKEVPYYCRQVVNMPTSIKKCLCISRGMTHDKQFHHKNVLVEIHNRTTEMVERNIHETTEETKNANYHEVTWLDVSLWIDKVCFISMLVVLVIGSLMFVFATGR